MSIFSSPFPSTIIPDMHVLPSVYLLLLQTETHPANEFIQLFIYPSIVIHQNKLFMAATAYSAASYQDSRS